MAFVRKIGKSGRYQYPTSSSTRSRTGPKVAMGRCLSSRIATAHPASTELNCWNCARRLLNVHLNPDDFFLHKFRATFATKHLQAGVDLRTVQLWLGHKDLESTMRYLKPARGKGIRLKVNATFH